jgi:hypothetical protein
LKASVAANDSLCQLCNGHVGVLGQLPEQFKCFRSVNIEALHQPAFGLTDDVPRDERNAELLITPHHVPDQRGVGSENQPQRLTDPPSNALVGSA